MKLSPLAGSILSLTGFVLLQGQTTSKTGGCGAEPVRNPATTECNGLSSVTLASGQCAPIPRCDNGGANYPVDKFTLDASTVHLPPWLSIEEVSLPNGAGAAFGFCAAASSTPGTLRFDLSLIDRTQEPAATTKLKTSVTVLEAMVVATFSRTPDVPVANTNVVRPRSVFDVDAVVYGVASARVDWLVTKVGLTESVERLDAIGTRASILAEPNAVYSVVALAVDEAGREHPSNSVVVVVADPSQSLAASWRFVECPSSVDIIGLACNEVTRPSDRARVLISGAEQRCVEVRAHPFSAVGPQQEVEILTSAEVLIPDDRAVDAKVLVASAASQTWGYCHVPGFVTRLAAVARVKEGSSVLFSAALTADVR